MLLSVRCSMTSYARNSASLSTKISWEKEGDWRSEMFGKDNIAPYRLGIRRQGSPIDASAQFRETRRSNVSACIQPKCTSQISILAPIFLEIKQYPAISTWWLRTFLGLPSDFAPHLWYFSPAIYLEPIRFWGAKIFDRDCLNVRFFFTILSKLCIDANLIHEKTHFLGQILIEVSQCNESMTEHTCSHSHFFVVFSHTTKIHPVI